MRVDEKLMLVWESLRDAWEAVAERGVYVPKGAGVADMWRYVGKIRGDVSISIPGFVPEPGEHGIRKRLSVIAFGVDAVWKTLEALGVHIFPEANIAHLGEYIRRIEVSTGRTGGFARVTKQLVLQTLFYREACFGEKLSVPGLKPVAVSGTAKIEPFPIPVVRFDVYGKFDFNGMPAFGIKDETTREFTETPSVETAVSVGIGELRRTIQNETFGYRLLPIEDFGNIRDGVDLKTLGEMEIGHESIVNILEIVPHNIVSSVKLKEKDVSDGVEKIAFSAAKSPSGTESVKVANIPSNA